MSIFYFPNPATLTFPSGGGGGGGAVDSVNGQTGVVVLDATDVGAANTDLSNLSLTTAVNADIIPDSNDTRNLGSNANRWQFVYAGTVNSGMGGLVLQSAANVSVDAPSFGISAAISLYGDGSNSRAFNFIDKDNSGHVSFRAPDTLSGNSDYILPAVLATAGQVLTDVLGDGTLSWQNAGSSLSFPLLAPTSSSMPQYSFADDSNTGFGQAAPSDIVLIIGNTIKWVWGSTGYFPQQDNSSQFGTIGLSVSQSWAHFFGVEKAGVFRWYDSTNTNYIDFKAPSSVAAPISYTLPGVLATPGQILTDVAGDGVLSWITNSGGGASTALDNLTTTAINASLLFDTDQAYSIGSGTAAAAVIYSQSYYGPTGTSVQVGSQGGHLVLLADGGQYVSIQANGASGIVPLRMYDSDSSNYIAIQPASTIASNFTLTWPAAVPTTSAQAIVSTTGGVLSFFAGANGSFTTVDLKTVTVVNGLITTIV